MAVPKAESKVPRFPMSPDWNRQNGQHRSKTDLNVWVVFTGEHADVHQAVVDDSDQEEVVKHADRPPEPSRRPDQNEEADLLHAMCYEHASHRPTACQSAPPPQRFGSGGRGEQVRKRREGGRRLVGAESARTITHHHTVVEERRHLRDRRALVERQGKGQRRGSGSTREGSGRVNEEAVVAQGKAPTCPQLNGTT